jgi:hypothetical protein
MIRRRVISPPDLRLIDACTKAIRRPEAVVGDPPDIFAENGEALTGDAAQDGPRRRRARRLCTARQSSGFAATD